MYKKQEREEIINLVRSGVPIADLAKERHLNKSTIHRWLKSGAKTISIDGIRAQLAALSRCEVTNSTARNIAMLSKSLSRLEGAEAKKRKTKTKLKPTVQMNEDSETLKARVLESKIGGLGSPIFTDEKGGERGEKLFCPPLYNYQKEFLSDPARFRIVLKSRQIGFSFVSALDALLGAVAGRNQLFLSASEEQALILMRYLGNWAQKLGVLFKRDSDYEKTLENGVYIKVMAHNFRTVQGFTGDIFMDEFAWYPNPKRIWDAFLPSVTACAGRLTILSTPFEEESFFHKLITDTDKYYMYSRHTVDIHRARADGLEVADFQTLRDMCDADTWASAYECQFIDDEAALLPIALIKSCVKDYRPQLPAADTPLYAGFDIGRVKDRSALAAVAALPSGGKIALCALDVLSKASFAEQERALGDFLTIHPLAMLKIDKTGIGMATAERLHARFQSRVTGVYFTAPTKEVLALNLKKHFEDGTIEIPNDPALIADIHAIKRKAGAKGFLYDSDRNEHGHADRFWALALALSYFETVRQKRGAKVFII